MLLLDLPQGSTRDAAQDIRDTVQRANELCRQLLRFSGRQELELADVDLAAVARELVRLMRPGIPANVRLSAACADTPVLRADATALHQVALNLVTNAVDAVRERGGAVMVRTGVEAFNGEAQSRATHDWREGAGRCVMLEVADDGVGMDQATLRRIFEPFFTTKKQGTGLGLASVLGTIKAHRGALEVRSSPGAGTTMRVLLPAEPARRR
jgi:signal transduction histidine kinase